MVLQGVFFDQLLKLGKRFGRPDILFWSLPYLMILIFVGTIAQKSMGLYDAQKMFFSSILFYWDFMPLPGGYSVLTLITLNMICKFIFLSPWTLPKLGTNLAHFSIIILCVGGLMTAMTIKEGYIALNEGQQDHFIFDYHKRVLSINHHDTILSVPFDDLVIDQSIEANLPFTITPIKTCRNISIRPRDITAQNTNRKGAAAMADITCASPLIENERNIAGISYTISNAKNTKDNGIYIAFETRETHDVVQEHTITLAREKRSLPFSIALNRFQRDTYPGTNMARDYESRVTIHDGDIKWPAAISMNEPLRYNGYSIYQASTFINRDGSPVSVLSVVKNKGWIFPYISGVFLAIGLIIHLIIRSRKHV